MSTSSSKENFYMDIKGMKLEFKKYRWKIDEILWKNLHPTWNLPIVAHESAKSWANCWAHEWHLYWQLLTNTTNTQWAYWKSTPSKDMVVLYL
jgi:hypothetical protein